MKDVMDVWPWRLEIIASGSFGIGSDELRLQGQGSRTTSERFLSGYNPVRTGRGSRQRPPRETRCVKESSLIFLINSETLNLFSRPELLGCDLCVMMWLRVKEPLGPLKNWSRVSHVHTDDMSGCSNRIINILIPSQNSCLHQWVVWLAPDIWTNPWH